MKKRNEVTVDARGKISLAFRRNKRHVRYLAEEAPDGTITLSPAVSVPAYLLRPQDDAAGVLSRKKGTLAAREKVSESR